MILSFLILAWKNAFWGFKLSKWINKYHFILQARATWNQCVYPTMHLAPLALSWCWKLCLCIVSHTWTCLLCAGGPLITQHWNTSPKSCHRYTHMNNILYTAHNTFFIPQITFMYGFFFVFFMHLCLQWHTGITHTIKTPDLNSEMKIFIYACKIIPTIIIQIWITLAGISSLRSSCWHRKNGYGWSRGLVS